MRKRCIMRVELMSDMCVSDGSSYNSMLDTDICYDKYGFPYIPAKRIRGCLRECALELNDWGDNIRIDILFGKAGEADNRAKLRIGDAILENYEEKRDFVANNIGHVLVHPQNILNCFSYIRTQTSINYDTGVADNKSLRTMRVANKGLVFNSDVYVEDEFYEDLIKCCKILKHMGIARTRGLGEVKVSLMESVDTSSKATDINQKLVDGASRIKYEIDLIEPVICKSVNGEESNTLDYIDGSKILGTIASDLSMDFIEFMSKGNLRCSNAYISNNGMRFTEVPGYIYKIKNDSDHYVNKLSETELNKKETREKQINQMNHSYALMKNGKIEFAEVMTEERNHHRRPGDKSIGRAMASADANADFYQMDSISAGQKFAGTIEGSPEQIAEVYRILTQNKDFYIGYSRSSEYGRVRIRVVETDVKKEQERSSANCIVVKLNAPTIIYNDNAMATTDPDVLIKEVLATLSIKVMPTEVDKFIRFTTLGGYNVTWKNRKPILQAFDKGTALRLIFEDTVMIPNGETIMIGERNAEGFGETEIFCYDKESTPYIGEIVDKSTEHSTTMVDVSSDFGQMLAQPLLDAFIGKEAANAAERTKIDRNVYRPTVSNMILMSKESTDLQKVKEAAKERYGGKSSDKKANKGRAADEIFANVDSVQIARKFCEEIGITGLKAEDEDLRFRYLKEYLAKLKYAMRGESK